MSNLKLFFEAVNNYDLFGQKKLIRSAVKACLDDDSDINYKIFMKEIIKHEIEGTNDLVDPIRKQ